MKGRIHFILALLSGLTLFPLVSYSQKNMDQKKKVLVLHSVEESRPWNTMFNNQLKESIKNNCPYEVELSIEYTDLILYHTEEYKDILEKSIRYKYKNNLPDIIIITQIEAANFVYERNLFPQTHKILIDLSIDLIKEHDHATNISVTLDFKTMLKHALDIFPQTKEVYVIAGNNNTDTHTLNLFINDMTVFQENISFKYLTNLNRAAIIDSIKKLPENSLVYYLAYTQDLDGHAVMAKDFSVEIAKNSNRPVFSFLDLLTEETGIFGGLVASLRSKAIKSVEIITLVFNGEDMETISPVEADYANTYDWQELKKWDIDIEQLPDSSIFYHRKYTFLELYKSEVIIGLFVLFSYTLLLILLLYSNRKKKISEQKLKIKNTHYELLNIEYKSQNELLKVEKERAEESDRLKLAFLLNMSHEIRTPMNSIIGFSEMLNDEKLDIVQRKEFTRLINNGSIQLLNIIDDILEISRLETHQVSIQTELFSVNILIKEMHDLFSLRIKEKGLSFTYETALDDENCYITSDKTIINRILCNLIENALKFTQQGFIKLGYLIKQNSLIFFVKDSGIGISSENMNRIFDRFMQEEKGLSLKYGGLGLGLAISKENASLLGGDITVESEKGKGSTFYFSIPYPANE